VAGSGDLFAAIQEFFNICVAALADTPAGAPQCAYISPGVPAWDACPCLVVHCGGPVVADTFPLQPALGPDHRVTVHGQVNLIVLTATILRCVPVITEEGGLPQPADFAAATQQTSADLWAIWNHVRQAKHDGTLFAPREREFRFEPPVAVNQQGGAGGWQITVRTELDGYQTS
jgi:hypothetical protein